MYGNVSQIENPLSDQKVECIEGFLFLLFLFREIKLFEYIKWRKVSEIKVWRRIKAFLFLLWWPDASPVSHIQPLHFHTYSLIQLECPHILFLRFFGQYFILNTPPSVKLGVHQSSIFFKFSICFFLLIENPHNTFVFFSVADSLSRAHL